MTLSGRILVILVVNVPHAEYVHNTAWHCMQLRTIVPLGAVVPRSMIGGRGTRLTTDWVDRVRGGMGCSASGVLQGIGLEKIMADKSPIRC